MEDEDENQQQNETGENLMGLVAGTAAGLRRAQASTEYTFMMPKESRFITVMEEAYRNYLDTVKGQGPQHEHGPPHLHRGLALLREMAKEGAVPAGIQEEFTAFKKWVEDLQELPMAEACVLIRRCQYAEVKDYQSGQTKAHRLHIHFEAMIVINQKIYTINQLVVKA